MTIASGTHLGPYEILDLVGAGGMGEVYRARDRRLGRHVAIKVLPRQTAKDRDLLIRFEREARLASSLNHPNIVTIYDIGEVNSIPYIAMELVDGKTLRVALSSGPLPIRQIAAYTVQIADALAKAHESGIMHRDLKPENIMITNDGIVKILDFGLGKNVLPPISVLESTQLAMADCTNPGTVLGSVNYMSPEQAAGKDADFRSDQFSFGSIIYEMSTGNRPFVRETAVQTMSAIISEPAPPLSKFNSIVPGPLRDVISRCMQKDPARRYASTRDMVGELRELSAVVEFSGTKLSKVVSTVGIWGWNWSSSGKWTVAALLVLAAIVMGLMTPAGRSLLDRSRGAPLPASKNLVVLPFQSGDGNADNQQFAAGLTEAITSALTQLTIDPSLQMSPSSEVTTPTRRIATADDARKILAANLVLTGKVAKSGDALGVNWSLEDTATHRQLRSRTITVKASEADELESRTIVAIADALDLKLQPAQREALLIRDTTIPAAKEAYLRGRGYLQEYDKPENVSHAITLFEDALKLDGKYARAFAGLGEGYWRQYERTRSKEWVDHARENCQKAITMNEKIAAGHGCLGMVDFGIGQYEDAVKEYRRALTSEPTNDDYGRGVARAEEKLGNLQDAEKTIKDTIRLRPQYWANYNVLGSFYFNQGRFSEAAETYSQVVKLAPDTAYGYTNLGGIYSKLGRYDEALVMFQRSVAIRPTPTAYSNLATTYFQRRKFSEAAATFEQATKIDGNNYLWWGNLGDAYYWAAGKREQAPAAYKKAIALGEEALKVNPRNAIVLSRLAVYNAMIDDRNSALSYLKRALEIAPDDPEVRFKAALIHNQFKDDDQTLGWLEKAAQAKYSITTIRDVPNFDHLWAYGRFQDLLRKY